MIGAMRQNRVFWLAVLISSARAWPPATAAAQGVTIAPPVVILDHRQRGGSLELFNVRNEPVEVSISLAYGFPVSDSCGFVDVRLMDAVPSSEPAATPWVDVYPRRIMIMPGQRQTIRFLARPPTDLPDREYWSRVIVTSGGAAIPVVTGDTSSGITVALNVTLRTITTLLYRKGSLQTALSVHDVRTSVAGDSLVVRAVLTPSGTAAWLGTVRGTLRSPEGRVVGRFERPMGIYYTLDPSFAIPLDRRMASGTYRLTVDAVTERPDLPRSSLVRAPDVSASMDIQIAQRPD